MPRGATKIVSREELLARVAALRERSQTVALANGCFDILHVGHTRYLEAAAREADLLVVAVNDDETVRMLKGAGRPMLAAAHRAELVAALRCVDFVTVFPEPTVGALLEALRPDVHCKGTDYTVDTVPERAIVAGYGGRTAIVGDPKDHSTKALVERASANAQLPNPKSQTDSQIPNPKGTHNAQGDYQNPSPKSQRSKP